MTSRQRYCLGAATMALIASGASPAGAQAPCSSAQQVDSGTAQFLNRFLPTQVGLSLAVKVCRGKEFVRRVMSNEDDPAKITPQKVFEASKPELDPDLARLPQLKAEYEASQAASERKDKEKRELREQREHSEHMRRNMADEAVGPANKREDDMRNVGIEITEPFQKWPEGQPEGSAPSRTTTPSDEEEYEADNEVSDAPDYYVLSPKDGDPIKIVGGGLHLSEDGMQKGSIDANGEIHGEGQEISVDGTWRVGNFDHGEMEGEGVEVGRDPSGRQYAMTGTFENDLPDGQVTISYAGGSRRRQLWDDGQVVSTGPMAAAGATLVDAPAPKLTPALAVYQESLQYEMVPQKPGGTLDGSFESNGQPTGEMIRRYADGTSQRELWENGQVIGRGAVSAKGTVPPHINRVYKPQVPPRSTWKTAIAPPPPPPRSRVTSSGSGWASVCRRNDSKIKEVIHKGGGINWDIATYDRYLRMWNPCRSYDPRAEEDYQMLSHYRSEKINRGTRDANAEVDRAIAAELDRAISDPNYSAELGPVRGEAGSVSPIAVGSGGGGPGGNGDTGNGEDGPAPGTSITNVNIAKPVLPAFHAKYTGRGLSPDTIEQQLASDLDLRRIQAQLNSTREVVSRLRLFIAQLEGRIVIMRQSQDFPDARKLIQGMTEARNAAIENCESLSSNPSLCTAPMR